MVADALSRHACVLKQLNVEVVGFERIKEYASCPDFGKIFGALKEEVTQEINGFLLQDDYLFWFRTLCIPRTSLRDYLVWELRYEGLAGHFRTTKDNRCYRELVLLTKPKTRCCEADREMSHLPICQAGKTKHCLVYVSTRARSPLARREYRFRS